MATHLSPPDLAPQPEARPPSPSRRGWRGALARGLLRLRAWRLCRGRAEAHPVACLIARGDWAALDQLLDDLDRR